MKAFSRMVSTSAKPLTALGIGNAVGLVGAREAAAADAEDQPAIADVIDCRDLLGEPQRMAKRQHLHGDADLHALGARGDCAGDVQGCGQHRTRRG